jgi:hypothetical protein
MEGLTMSKEVKDLLVVNTDGAEFIVRNVPANAKITYGALPGANNNMLRIYTGTCQIAAFPDVKAFRDLSLGIFRSTTKVTGSLKKTSWVEVATDLNAEVVSEVSPDDRVTAAWALANNNMDRNAF